MLRMLVLSVLFALGWLALVGPGPAQVPVPQKPPTIPFKIVAGRLFVRAELRSEDRHVPAHLLLELGRPDALFLHQNTAALLELKPDVGGELELDFGDFTAPVLLPEIGRNRFLEYLTAEYARELDEIPVVGILGVRVFGDHRLRLDYDQQKLTLLPRKVIEPGAEVPDPLEPPRESEPEPEPEPGTEKATHETPAPPVVHRIPMRAESGYFRFKVEVDRKRVLDAAPATSEPDTWIAAGIAEQLGHPAGDVTSARLGPVDLTTYVALRPGDVPNQFPGQPDLLIGHNFLSHFRVTLDPHLQILELEPMKKPRFPVEEQACFKALVARDAGALEAFLKEHGKHRLAPDASNLLLELRLDEEPLQEKELNTAVQYHAESQPAKRRTRVVLQLLKQLAGTRPEAYSLVRKTALDIALANARQDEDPAALHRARSEIGAVLLEKGNIREAYRHLLSAAFGLPEDGMINLRLGWLYEEKGQDERAWSRYLQAAITEEGGAEGLDGLKRLADKKGVKTPYDVDELEKLLEGRVPSYQPASTYEPPEGKITTRRVLAELFTGTHAKPGAAAELAFEALPYHFSHGQVVVLVHHLHAPRPSALACPAATARAQQLNIRTAPAVVLDGRHPVPRVGGPPDKAAREFRKVRQEVEARLLDPTPWVLTVEGRLHKNQIALTVRVQGPEAENLRLRLYLCEKTMLLPSESKMVLHRFVTRADVARGGVAVSHAAGERVIERTIDLAEIQHALDQHLDAVEDRAGREFPLRPARVPPRQVVVVAFLEGAGGQVEQAASWEATGIIQTDQIDQTDPTDRE